jgi:TrmH family RNA methyltransferase
MIKEITSVNNAYIKQMLKLQEKSRERKKTGLFLIEGQREILLTLSGGYHIKTILYCPDYYDINQLIDTTDSQLEIISLSKEVYQKLAVRSSTEGMIALVESKDFSIQNIRFNNESPLILVAEAPEKPGNIGALLRTADAANIDAVLIANPKTDLYNPNIIRSSIGCLFTNQIGVGSTDEIIQFLKDHSIEIYCATLQDAKDYSTIDFSVGSAIVVGTESSGLSSEWRNQSTENIFIPMEGKIDSMNVSVAAGILIFEAKRQRKIHP